MHKHDQQHADWKRFSKTLYGCLFSAWSAGWHHALCWVSPALSSTECGVFASLRGLVLPDVSVDVKVRTIYVLAACSSHQTYKGSPHILHTSTNSRTSTWHILGLTGECTEAVLKMLKRPLFIIRFVCFFHYFKEQTMLLCVLKVKRTLVQDHCRTVVAHAMAATSSVTPVHTIWQF